MDDHFIHLDDVHLTFRIHAARTYSIKETVVNALLRRNYGKGPTIVNALRGISLKIPNGQRLGIIGDNGSGKSSMLKVISKIYPPTSGAVRYQGFLVPLLEVGIGFNFELSGLENIFLTGAIMGIKRKAMMQKVDSIFEFSELGDFADTPVKYYSSGMTQRLAFSIATEVDPEILLLDEIFSAGDIHWMERAETRMRGLIDRTRILVLVSHQMDLFEKYCDRVIWMQKGQIVADGDPVEIVDRYRATAGAGAGALTGEASA